MTTPLTRDPTALEVVTWLMDHGGVRLWDPPDAKYFMRGSPQEVVSAWDELQTCLEGRAMGMVGNPCSRVRPPLRHGRGVS